MPKKLEKFVRIVFLTNISQRILDKKILPSWKVQQNSLIARLIPKAFKLINRM